MVRRKLNYIYFLACLNGKRMHVIRCDGQLVKVFVYPNLLPEMHTLLLLYHYIYMLYIVTQAHLRVVLHSISSNVYIVVPLTCQCCTLLFHYIYKLYIIVPLQVHTITIINSQQWPPCILHVSHSLFACI